MSFPRHPQPNPPAQTFHSKPHPPNQGEQVRTTEHIAKTASTPKPGLAAALRAFLRTTGSAAPLTRRPALLFLPALVLASLVFSSAPAWAAGAPTVVSEFTSPTAKSSVEVRFEAAINPNEEATKCDFQYGETSAYGHEVACTEPGETAEGGEQRAAVTVVGLQPGTTYHYRVILKNTSGKAEGGDAETATVPVPKTEEVPNPIGATTATFKGELTPLNPTPPVSSTPTEYFFFYNFGEDAACTNERATNRENASLITTAVSTAVTELESDQKYTVCLVSANAFGSEEDAASPPVHFETPPGPPVVVAVSESASAITPFDATLVGQVNPENQETTYHLEYATEAAKLGTVEATALAYGVAPPNVSSDVTVGPVDLGGGLTPNTTYYYRVVAENKQSRTEGQPADGTVESFKTLVAEKPSVEGEKLIGAAGGISDTIEAQLNPEYQGVASCEVQYVTKAAYEAEATKFSENVVVAGCSLVPPLEEFGAGGLPVPFTAVLGELKENEAYEYRILASNGTGTFEGVPQALLRTAPQITGALEVSEITQHTALIKPSTVDPEMIAPEVEAPLAATYYILYGTGEAGDLLSARTSAGSGFAPNPVTAVELDGLAPGTTYHYALVAYNGNATTTSPEATFTTAAPEPLTTPPAVGTEAAQFVNETGAVIEAEINTEGLQTAYEVQYGTSTAYGSSAPGPTALHPNTTAQGTITALTGLAPGTTYHYRIVASNGAGTTYGPDAPFTTTGAARTAVFTPFSVPTVPQIAIVPFTFPKEPGSPASPKSLTNKQKLAKALKACAKKHNRAKRAACRRQAKRTYR
jgi:hypothetical protein